RDGDKTPITLRIGVCMDQKLTTKCWVGSSDWLDLFIRSLYGVKSRAVARSKCVNALLQDVPPRICFGDPKCDWESALRLGRPMNYLALDPSADADCKESFYRPDAPRAFVVAAEDEQRRDI